MNRRGSALRSAAAVVATLGKSLFLFLRPAVIIKFMAYLITATRYLPTIRR